MSFLDNAPEARLSRLGGGLHAAGLATAAALFAVVYIPAIGALDSEQARIAQETEAAAQLAASADSLREEHRRLLAQQTESQTRTAQLLARIPHSPQESEFLAHIATLARDAPLLIRNFRPVATHTHDRYSEVEVQLSAAGTWAGLCRFLAGLETLPRLCRVSRLNIDSQQADDGLYPAELTFAIYFTPERKTPNRSAAPGGAPGRSTP